jgi:hypothetical protein
MFHWGEIEVAGKHSINEGAGCGGDLVAPGILRLGGPGVSP